MFFLEKICSLNDQQKKFLDYVVDHHDDSMFPFYIRKSTRNITILMHSLMLRTIGGGSGKIVSSYYAPFYDIFKSFCSQNNIKVEKVLRATVNYTLFENGLSAYPHVDHAFPHFNFVLYLNDCVGGHTLIYGKGEEEGKVIKSIRPEKYKAVIFSGESHAVSEIEPSEQRIVVVFTFTSQGLYE
jgi:hypothetical protein